MPNELSTVKTFFIISAIANILFLLGVGIGALVGGSIMAVATCGIGCLFFILPLINLISCIMDFIAFNKLNNMSSPGTFGSMQMAAILDIVSILTGNVISLILGILSLMYINKPEVKSYLQSKNIY